MFKKAAVPVLDKVVDWLQRGFFSSGAGGWLGPVDSLSEENTGAPEKKQAEFYLFGNDYLAKIRFEACRQPNPCRFRLKAVVLELDGRPILEGEQEEKAVEIIKQLHISEKDQRDLVQQSLANFGVDLGRGLRIVDQNFAWDFVRFQRLRANLFEKKETKK